MSKTVMLDWSSRRFEVTEEGYNLIREVISRHQICPTCHSLIDQEEHLLVAKKCLACVLREHPSITFAGLQRVDSDGDKIYAFVNQEGIVLTSEENSSEKPEEDVAFSIEQAGFTIPTTYKPFKSTENLRLGRASWKVYGKLSASVVVLHYYDYYSKGRIEIDYLAYKGGQTIEFNKRTTEHKNMLEKARNLAERTKKGSYYHLNGQQLTQIEDADLFQIIAMLESAVNNEQLAFLALQEPEQPQPDLFTLQEDSAPSEQDQSQQEEATEVEEANQQIESEVVATQPEQEQQEETQGKSSKRKLRVVQPSEEDPTNETLS